MKEEKDNIPIGNNVIIKHCFIYLRTTMLVQTSWFMVPTIRTNYIYTKTKINKNHVGITFWLPNHTFIFMLDGPGLGSHEDGVSMAVMDAEIGTQSVVGSSSSSEHCSSSLHIRDVAQFATA